MGSDPVLVSSSAPLSELVNALREALWRGGPAVFFYHSSKPAALHGPVPAEAAVVVETSGTTGAPKQVWLTKHQRLDQKIGYFIQNCGRKPNREQVKRMAKPITNGGIQCLINEKEINKHSIKNLFRRWANDFKPSFHYHNGPKIITIEYADRNTKSIQDIKSKLTYLVSTV